MTELTKAQLATANTATFDGLPRRTQNAEILAFMGNVIDSIMPRVEADATVQTINSDIGSLASRIGAVETAIGTLATSATVTTLAGRVTAAESAATTLAGRVTTAENTLGTLGSDVTSLKAWRAAKATASADVSTSVSVPTAVITLGLNAPTAAGLNALFSTIMGEVNGLKAILRTREILAA